MKTVTLETARRLNNAGYFQYTHFFWKITPRGPELVHVNPADIVDGPEVWWVSAPTAGELLEWFQSRGEHISIWYYGNGWSAELDHVITLKRMPEGYHPAEALGLLAIKVLEEKHGAVLS